jgi:hypothetical protein
MTCSGNIHPDGAFHVREDVAKQFYNDKRSGFNRVPDHGPPVGSVSLASLVTQASERHQMAIEKNICCDSVAIWPSKVTFHRLNL